MTPDQITGLRLAHQRLVGPRFDDPVQAVHLQGAVQAQDFAGAKWGLALRTTGRTDADLDRLFDDGALLRTHVLRPTWHFVAPGDLRWMLKLTGPRIQAQSAGPYRNAGLTPEILASSRKHLEKALQGGQSLTRTELAERFQQAGIPCQAPLQLIHLLADAELEGVICSGPRRGKQFTYALLEERVPPAPPRTRDESLHQLALRYFLTRGPATAQDFAWWSGLTLTDARHAAQLAKDQLARQTIEGRPCWGPLQPAPPQPTEAAFLLPNYDEYFIGFRDRSAIQQRILGLAPNFLEDVVAAHIVILGGQVVGGWKRALSSKSVAVEVRLLMDLTPPELQAIQQAAQRYGEFLQLPVQLDIRDATRTEAGFGRSRRQVSTRKGAQDQA